MLVTMTVMLIELIIYLYQALLSYMSVYVYIYIYIYIKMRGFVVFLVVLAGECRKSTLL